MKEDGRAGGARVGTATATALLWRAGRGGAVSCHVGRHTGKRRAEEEEDGGPVQAVAVARRAARRRAPRLGARPGEPDDLRGRGRRRSDSPQPSLGQVAGWDAAGPDRVAGGAAAGRSVWGELAAAAIPLAGGQACLSIHACGSQVACGCPHGLGDFQMAPLAAGAAAAAGTRLGVGRVWFTTPYSFLRTGVRLYTFRIHL